MRPTVRRIDLTQTPTAVEVWPTLDWLEPVPGADRSDAADRAVAFDAEHRSSMVRGPRGRSGLWDAMASAVQRARECSSSGAFADDEQAEGQREQGDAEIIEMTVDTPHLAYLARVACGNGTGRDDLPGADVIALVDARTRNAS